MHSLDLYPPTSVAYLSILNQLKIQLQTRTHVGSLSSVAYLSMGISEEKISLDHFFKVVLNESMVMGG